MGDEFPHAPGESTRGRAPREASEIQIVRSTRHKKPAGSAGFFTALIMCRGRAQVMVSPYGLHQSCSSQGYCSDRAAVDSLLAVTGIAAIRVRNPGLVVPEFEHFGAQLAAKPASDAEFLINLR